MKTKLFTRNLTFLILELHPFSFDTNNLVIYQSTALSSADDVTTSPTEFE